jgi:hypothetical protein
MLESGKRSALGLAGVLFLVITTLNAQEVPTHAPTSLANPASAASDTPPPLKPGT